MDERGLTGSDALAVSAMTDGNRNAGMGLGNGGEFAIFILALLMMNGGWGGMGRFPGGVSDGDLAASQAAQTTQLQMSNLLSGQQGNLFDIARMSSYLTLSMMSQHNANLINAIHGFNSLGQQITNQTNTISTQISQMASQLSSCCCEIKTQMLQDRLDAAERRNVVLQNAIDNNNQTQTILSQLGRYVTWAGTGSPAVGSAVTSNVAG